MHRNETCASLWIPGPLPGLNELIAAAKGSGGRGAGYARLKREWTEAVWALANLARLGSFDVPVTLMFRWSERDRRRDPDNVAAGGRKLVLDGLVKAGVLRGDGWQHIAGWADEWQTDRKRPGVLVSITGQRDLKLEPHADAAGARAGGPQASAQRPEDAALERDPDDQRRG
jgi:hypothetical protein